MARIISVVSGKGGVGKTTLVANVGTALSHHFKKRVTVVDCNLTTSHLGMALGIHHTQTNLNHVLRGEAPLSEAIYTVNSGLRVLPASLKLSEMSGVDLARLRPFVKKLAEDSDFVILDAGPGLGREAVSALHSSEEVIFIATPTLPSVMDVLRCQEFLRDHDKRHLGLVLNMVQKQESQMSQKEVEKMLGMQIVALVPRDSAVPRALAAEVPSVLSFPDSLASREFMNVARHIAGLPIERQVRVSALDTVARTARSWLERISKFPSLE